MKHLTFTAHDDKVIHYYVWEAKTKEVKGLLQISHGMAEAPSRYNDFAEFMAEKGYTVFADAHRAHGATDNCSGYSEGDIYTLTLTDMAKLNIIMRNSYPGKKLVLFGHSYGSFLTQGFIEDHGELADGFIIGGSAYMSGAELDGGGFNADTACNLGMEKQPAKNLAKLSFGKYNARYKDGTTFISSIKEECDRYNEDKECGFILSIAFYKYMFRAFKRLYRKDYYQKIDINKKVLIISGKEDPVGGYGKTTQKLYDFYKDTVKIKDVRLKFYEGVRHEYLNDISRDEARADILNFCEEIC